MGAVVHVDKDCEKLKFPEVRRINTGKFVTGALSPNPDGLMTTFAECAQVE